MTQLTYTFSDDDSMQPPFTQHPPNDDIPVSSITGMPIPRPSDSWLRRPAYIGAVIQMLPHMLIIHLITFIDGARNPPLFFHSPQAIDEAVAAWAPRTGIWPDASPPVRPQPSRRDTP
ncbi:hypothetical protein NMY22_g1370 [Coprinellus aureogranulatus]|nr:hypothetical protein NMY22_g1370 [Coprinellus aureogranulatus]